MPFTTLETTALNNAIHSVTEIKGMRLDPDYDQALARLTQLDALIIDAQKKGLTMLRVPSEPVDSKIFETLKDKGYLVSLHLVFRQLVVDWT